MRLHYARIPTIVKDILAILVDKKLVEIAANKVAEVELDVESVLKEYLRADRALTDESKDMANSQGLDYSAYQKIKRKLAEQRRFGIHEDAIEYLSNQVIETFLHTGNVDEVFAADIELRAAIAPVLKRHMADDNALDEEVRRRIKNLQEGTQAWDIQYQQTMERLKRLRKEL